MHFLIFRKSCDKFEFGFCFLHHNQLDDGGIKMSTMRYSLPTGIQLALLVLRVISPAFVFFSSLSLFFLRPSPPTSPSPITSVVISRRVPRRATILLFLTLCSLTYLGDGLTFIVHAIIQHNWPWYSGIEVNALLGVVAFSGLAALGTWKDLHGLRIWDLKRVSFSVALSLVLDIALVIMIGLKFRQGRSCFCSSESPIY